MQTNESSTTAVVVISVIFTVMFVIIGVVSSPPERPAEFVPLTADEKATLDPQLLDAATNHVNEIIRRAVDRRDGILPDDHVVRPTLPAGSTEQFTPAQGEIVSRQCAAPKDFLGLANEVLMGEGPCAVVVFRDAYPGRTYTLNASLTAKSAGTWVFYSSQYNCPKGPYVGLMSRYEVVCPRYNTPPDPAVGVASWDMDPKYITEQR